MLNSLVLFFLVCNKFPDDLDGSVNSKGAGIETQIIAGRFSPLFACVVIIVAGSALIRLADQILGLCVRQIVASGNPRNACLEIRVEKYIDYIGNILQGVIRTSSHDDAGSL